MSPKQCPVFLGSDPDFFFSDRVIFTRIRKPGENGCIVYMRVYNLPDK